MKKQWLRYKLLISLVVLLMVTHGYAQQGPTVTPPASSSGSDQISYVVQRGTVQETFIFNGQWLPRDQQVISFEVAGTVQSINVQPNDLITTGTLLASFPIEDLQIQLNEARTNLENVRLNQTANLGTANVVRSQIDLANANLDLQSTIDGAPWTEVNGAQLDLEEAQDELDLAERNYNNAIGDPSNPPSVIDGAYEDLRAAKRAVQQAQNRYWAAAQNYNVYQYRIDRAENQVIRQELDLSLLAQSSTTANPQFDELNQAQARVDQLTNAINQSSLFAPFDGIVIDVSVNRGTQVQAFQKVMTLAILEPQEVFANLSLDDAQRLTVGMIGICRVNNQPETAVQCIVRKLPADNSLESVRIAASLDNVPMGQLIEVEMPLGVREDVLWLPADAIRTFQNRTFVVVQAPDGERVVDITIGLRTRDRVEIVSGLSEGDIVIGQ